MKANYQLADGMVLFHIVSNPFLFLKMRKEISEIAFEPSHRVIFLLYCNRKSLERLGFEPGKNVEVWRTWKDGAHYVGIRFGLPLVRKTLIHVVLHEIGHVICHETGHASHRVSFEALKTVHDELKEKTTIYQQALDRLFARFPLLKNFGQMCQIPGLGEVLKEFYANDIMMKYYDPEKRLEGLLAEAEDICQDLYSLTKKVPIVFGSPFAIIEAVMTSAVSEASASRITRHSTSLGNKFQQHENRLADIYEGLPREASKLRQELVLFLINLSENPSSSDVSRNILVLRDFVLDFFDIYKRWLLDLENLLKNAQTLRDVVKTK